MMYRVYRLDGRRQIIGAPDYFEAADDDSALSAAQGRPHRHLMEVWAGERFVGLIASAAVPDAARALRA